MPLPLFRAYSLVLISYVGYLFNINKYTTCKPIAHVVTLYFNLPTVFTLS